MQPTITAFAESPDQGRGLARDMPVRWACEEVGRPYEVQRLCFAELAASAHRGRNPFGQIPTWQDGALTLFESGAIVLHIAEGGAGLLPEEPVARARAIMWMMAALSTVEPPIVEREQVGYLEVDRPWHAERLPLLDARIDRRLGELAAWLGEAPWLEDTFSAGDLMMVSVLRRLGGSDSLARHPALNAYVRRAEARPAFARAFASQHAAFLEACAKH